MKIVRLLSISILLSAACLARADTASSSTAGGEASAQMRAQSASQTNTTATSAVTGRKFEKMAESEIQDFLAQLEKQPFPAILQAGIDADRLEHDGSKTRYIFLDALPEAMKRRLPGQVFLDQLKGLINDKDASESERLLLIDALGRAQRQETAALLLELAATTRSDPAMHWEVGGAIGELGRTGEKFTPLLEHQWLSSDNDHDQRILERVARGMVDAGGLSSVNLLLDAALAQEGKNDARKEAALYALEPRIDRPLPVSPLAARLSVDDPTGQASQLVSTILGCTREPAAAEALVTWMQKTGDSAAPLARKLALGSLEPKIWEAALKPEVPFRSEKVRAAVRAGLDDFGIIQKNVVLIPDLAKAVRYEEQVTIPFTIQNNSNVEVKFNFYTEREIDSLDMMSRAGKSTRIWERGLTGHGFYLDCDLKPGETASGLKCICDIDTLAVADGAKVFATVQGHLKETYKVVTLVSDSFLLPHALMMLPYYDLGTQTYLSITPDLSKISFSGGSLSIPATVKNVSDQDVAVATADIRYFIATTPWTKTILGRARRRYNGGRSLRPGESASVTARSVEYEPGDKITVVIDGFVPNTKKVFDCYSEPFEIPPPPGEPPR